MKTIHGQPSWQLSNKTVEASITRLGGHLAPVIFDRRHRRISPYSIAPWAAEKIDSSLPKMLKALRGDFFCCPFGGNATPYRGEKHPPHGETANNIWKLESLTREELHVSLPTKIRRGRVDKFISLREGHNAIYSRHVISGMTGPIDFGHHATLKFPDEPGSGIISTSPFVYGQVFPFPFERPEEQGYQSLRPGVKFTSLKKVEQISGEYADLTRYPARRGFEDLAMVVSDPKSPLAWTAVTFPNHGYVWFSLKNPQVLRNTIFWISNGGRYMAPWSGRHISVMGLEETTSYFHCGLAESANKNPLTAKGHPTCVQMNPRDPLTINYIMAVALVPKGFNRVANITANLKNSTVTLKSDNGKKTTIPLDASFVL